MKKRTSLILLLLSVSSFAATPGLTEKEIVIGATTLDTGPYAMYSAVGSAQAAYYDMVNAKGGVNGRKIKFIRADTHSDFGKALEGTKKLVEQDNVFAVAGAVGTFHLAGYKYLIENNIPDVFTNDGVSAYTSDPSNSLVYPATYSFVQEGNAMGEYMAKTYPGKKVCMLVNDNPIGNELAKGVNDAFVAHKLTAPHTEKITRDQLQADAEITRLKGEKCDVVFTTHTAQFAAEQMNYSFRHEFKPKWLSYRYNANDKFLELLDEGAREGIVVNSFVATGENSKVSGWAEFKKVMEKNNIVPSGTSAMGYYMAELFVHALREADKQWGKGLDREKFLKTVQNLKGWKCSICYEPINLSAENHWALKPTLLVSKNNQWVQMK